MKKVFEAAVGIIVMAILMAMMMYALIMPDPISEAKNREWAAEAAALDAERARDEFHACMSHRLAGIEDPSDEQYFLAQKECEVR